MTQRRLAAILAADVVGYSRLMGQDEAGTLAALKGVRAELIDLKIAEHKGRVFKSTGDGLLAEFPSVVNSIACAVDIQRGMQIRNMDPPENREIWLRIGVNLGDVIVEGDDIFGDGVNVAARLEGVASPGGIAVSAVVRDQIGNRLNLEFEDMGEQKLKNIAELIRVFRIAGGRGPQSYALSKSADNTLSIAVLPFDNMSGIPEHDYIGQCIAENIITDLSRFRDLTVMARNSSFAYKGKATRVQDIRQDLSVNYILEGSVQRAGDRIRITAQLVDGGSGNHIWAERYDRKVDDLFAVMDEVTELIVGTLGTTYGGRLRRAAGAHISTTGPKDFRAFDYFLKGIEEFNRFTKDSVAECKEDFANAVAIDPKYAKAHAKIAWAHLVDIAFGWSIDPTVSFAKARDAADAAVHSDDAEAWSYWALAGCAMYNQQTDRALSLMKRALELNPNDADVLTDMGLFCAYAGRAEEGLAFALKAIRMNPHHPDYYSAQLSQIYFDARQYDDAIRTIESIRTLNTPAMLLYLAASQAATGHDEAARTTAARLRRDQAYSTISYWTSPETAPYKQDSDRNHLASNLRKAGLPE